MPVTLEPVPLVVKTALVDVLVEDEALAGAEIATVGARLSTVKLTVPLPDPEALVAVTTTVWAP